MAATFLFVSVTILLVLSHVECGAVVGDGSNIVINAAVLGPAICTGETCKKTLVIEEINNDVIGGYCYHICHGNVKDNYHTECQCDAFAKDRNTVCTTTYLEAAVCSWSKKSCNGDGYCQWRRNAALSLIAAEKITTCDCPLTEKSMKSPCDWLASEMTLCSVLKEYTLLYPNFQCLCDANPPPQTPGQKNVCEYTKARPAQMTTTRAKRIFAGADAIPCNYPGVVGLFSHMKEGKYIISCTGTLLNDHEVLFDNQCKQALQDPVYALVHSYDTSKLDKSIQLDLTTIKAVDPDRAGNALYTGLLTTHLTFDDQCAQPACLPNYLTPANQIDFTDCRVLGYGETTNEIMLNTAKKLQEVRVIVDPTSVIGNLLTIKRADGLQNTACLSDFSAPVVCPHLYTKEWITVGIHEFTGPVCSGEKHPKSFQVANLLSEALWTRYYNRLIPYQPSHNNEVPV